MTRQMTLHPTVAVADAADRPGFALADALDRQHWPDNDGSP
jgi:hypothetical protein